MQDDDDAIKDPVEDEEDDEVEGEVPEGLLDDEEAM